MQGRDAVHQIDVLWEFEVGGFKYTTVIQAKDWITQKVDQGKLLQFKCVLADLPNQPRGLVVARKGFQSGAIEFAKKNGILIYELREPNEADWNGRMRTFNIKANEYTPNFTDIKLIQDTDWNVQELLRLNRLPKEAPKIDVSDDLIFQDMNGVEVTTALILFNSLVPEGFDELPRTKITYQFDKPTFIKTLDPQIRAKLESIEVKISKTLETKEYQLKGEDFVGYILKNVLDDDDVKTFPKRMA